DVALVTLEPQAEITAAYGLRVRPDGVLDGPVDLLVVSGGGWVARGPRGIRAEVERGALPRRIAELPAAGPTIARGRTGAMAGAGSGWLDGRPATTHHGAIDDLRATKAQVVEARVVDAGSVLTCGGVTSSLHLALWVVERFWGADTADSIARFMEHP